MDKVCACGCGRVIPPNPRHKYREAKFVTGHRANTPLRYTPKPDEIPSGLCECGCGEPTKVSKNTYRWRRWFKGHPRPFKSGHSPKQLGPDNPQWKGGRIYNRGYILIYMPDDARANSKGYYPEHRLVWENAHGPLEPNMQVHHINGITDDNRIKNLVALTHQEHRAEHREQQREIGRRIVSRTPTFASDIGKKGATARWKGHVKKAKH